MKAVLDACVLFPTVLREILQGSAEEGLYQPVFSDRILREWVLATAKLGPEAPAIAEGEAALLRATFPRALIREQPQIEARLLLPDPNDRHVLATAIAHGADAIVTFNRRIFRAMCLPPKGLRGAIRMASCGNYSQAIPKEWLGSSRPSGKGETIFGQTVTLESLLKRARLYRLAKALGA